MSGTDAINLGISVGLGVLSLGMSGFAIWLSFQFNDRSKKALDTVQELTREIKTSVEVGLSQQQDMSDKMLDSILDQNRYTNKSDGVDVEKKEKLESIVKGRMDKAEERIVNRVEDIFSKFDNEEGVSTDNLDRALKSIRSDIKELRETASDASAGFATTEDLRSILTKYKSTPAHYALLAAILKTNANSVTELDRARSKIFFPRHHDSGVRNLIEDGILVGSMDDFDIREELRGQLEDWVDANWSSIRRLSEYYREEESRRSEEEEPVGVVDEEVEIANNIDF
jgi:predicted transcriptional regulator